MLEAKLALTEAESKRWQQETAATQHSLCQLQAQLGTLQQQRSDPQGLASQQAALLWAKNQIQLLTESNESYGCASEACPPVLLASSVPSTTFSLSVL